MNSDPESRTAKRDRLDKALQAFLEERRASGDACSEQEAREFASLFRKLADPPLEVTPDGWAEQALGLIGASSPPDRQKSPERARAFSEIVRDAARVAVGVLVFDTALEPLAGVRSVHPQPRQILIAYPVGRLYLQVDRKEDRLDLIGQFIPTDRSGLPELRSAQVTSGGNSHEVPLPESGEFRFRLPLESSLDLHLRWGEASLIEHVKS
jgi:hypothetical protein